MQEPTELPPPLIELAIEAKNSADLGKLNDALLAMTSEDPLLRVASDQESGQLILKGMDERHLDTKVDLLRRRYGLELHLGAPQVAYLETMARPVEQDVTHDTQVAGDAQFARVVIVFEPKEGYGKAVFAAKFSDEAMPADYVTGIENGIRSVMRAGTFAGFPVVAIKATLIDGTFREGASSVSAFEMAARTASRQALHSGGTILLEPIMRIEENRPARVKRLPAP